MASIEKKIAKDGSPRYRLRYRVGERTCEEWFRTLEAARAQRTKLDGGTVDPRGGRVKLDDYFAAWLDERLVKGRPLSASTRLGYRRLYDRNLAGELGPRQLRRLTPAVVRDMALGRLGQGRPGPGGQVVPVASRRDGNRGGRRARPTKPLQDSRRR